MRLYGIGVSVKRHNQIDGMWWARKDLNLGPTDYEFFWRQ
jgi:hypothetical protein